MIELPEKAALFVRQAVAHKKTESLLILGVKDVGDDTLVKRSESLET